VDIKFLFHKEKEKFPLIDVKDIKKVI